MFRRQLFAPDRGGSARRSGRFSFGRGKVLRRLPSQVVPGGSFVRALRELLAERFRRLAHSQFGLLSSSPSRRSI